MRTASAESASPVTFRRFMESALYDEGGFYAGRSPKGDFYTAPELHPIFAKALADEVVRRLQALEKDGASRPYHVVEMGSGSGLLAEQILAVLRRDHAEWLPDLRYVLIERERKLLVESVLRLSDGAAHLSGLSDISEQHPCSGVFFSNELVDALPFHLLEKKGGKVREVYVREDGSTVAGELSTPDLRPWAKRCADMEEGLRHAVSLEALRWIGAVARALRAGYLITIDYGARLGPSAVNPPRAFFRHTVDERLTVPGRDLTANVDFEALIQEGELAGLELESFSSLARFMLDGPLAAGLPATDPKSVNQIKTLLHPDGMGEVFKVLVQKKAAGTR